MVTRAMLLLVSSAALALLVWNAAQQPKVDIVLPSSSGVCSAAAISFSAVDLPAHSTHDNQPRRMEHLGAMYADLRSKHASLLRRLYIVELGTARSTIPTQMRKSEHLLKVHTTSVTCTDRMRAFTNAGLEAQGRDARAFEDQVTVGISSRFLPGESLAFNRVRAQRFGGDGDTNSSGASLRKDPEGLVEELRSLPCQLPTASDFCAPMERTMADARVGYLSNDDAVGFANMGRLTAHHGVVATRHFVNPLRLGRADVVAMFTLTHEWFLRTSAEYPTDAQFPSVTFDLLHSGGASQTHPHMQPHLAASRYPGKWEAMRLAACDYADRRARSLFMDVALVHAHLGLVIRRTDHFVAFVALTSVSAGIQIDIMGDARVSNGKRGAANLNRELGGIFYDVLAAAQLSLGWEGSSASCVFPPMDPFVAKRASMPRLCRLVSRGLYSATVSDVSSNELFETPAVSTDLFVAAASLRVLLQSGSFEGHRDHGPQILREGETGR